MKTLLTLTLTAALAGIALAQAPAPITAADVPDSITMATPAAVKAGIAASYNKAVADAFTAHTVREAAKPVADRIAFVAPTVLVYMRDRIRDVYQSYAAQDAREDLSATRIETKWDRLTPAQRATIKAALATVTE